MEDDADGVHGPFTAAAEVEADVVGIAARMAEADAGGGREAASPCPSLAWPCRRARPRPPPRRS